MSIVGFIGTGHIASHMARAVARAGFDVIVSRRNETVSSELAASGLGIRVADDNHDLVAEADIVILSLRPAVWQSVCGSLPWRDDQQVISVMAGVRMADLEAICAPVEEISVTIPFASIEHGGCPLPVLGDPSAITQLFGGANPILPVADEAAFLRHFAASSMVAGALGLLGAGNAWLAGKNGVDVDYLGPLMAGFLQNLQGDSPVDLTREAHRLASPNTLSLQMFQGLAEIGAFDAVPGLLDQISMSMDAKA